ncbi:MAG TPA: Rieske 2Fe-2S domain-containing protein [Egibacteraceae bacterium]|nr:Rieske 2Fe-2S domain-containing protein [Egibacteraceae bacterium]
MSEQIGTKALQQAERPLPDEVIPYGWYHVGWSAELNAEDVVPLAYFDRHLVMYRGTSGEVHVLDAHCAHLGAHMGYGGKVSCEDIVCPFHGWRWNHEGENVEVPYSDRPSARRIGAWPVAERNGCIFVWYHPQGGEPLSEPPVMEEESPDSYFPVHPDGAMLWSVTFPPQYAAENLVDFAHFKYVHAAATAATLEGFEVQGPHFTSVLGLLMGEGKESTWMTPTGPTPAKLVTRVFGPGVNTVRFEVSRPGIADVIVMTAVTPETLSPCKGDLRISILVRAEDLSGQGRDPAWVASRWYAEERRQVDQDVMIWNNMRYLEKAPFPPSEFKAFNAMRRWSRQFYLVER